MTNQFARLPPPPPPFAVGGAHLPWNERIKGLPVFNNGGLKDLALKMSKQKSYRRPPRLAMTQNQ